MATLTENAAAVKAAARAIDAAIAAKGGTTEGGLNNAAAAIEALPSGGGEWVLKPWVMDESDPTELDGWIHLWFNFDSAIEAVAIFNAQFVSNGHTFTVDWGDGTVETIAASTNWTTRNFYHKYSEKGCYQVDVVGYDSVRLNQLMFTTDVNSGNQRAAIGIRQAQFGSYDEDTGLNCKTAGYGLRAVTWSGEMKRLGYYAFAGCASLTSVGDLSACTSIGYTAFRVCTSLTSVGDLSACTSIGASAFNGCYHLGRLVFGNMKVDSNWFAQWRDLGRDLEPDQYGIRAYVTYGSTLEYLTNWTNGATPGSGIFPHTNVRTGDIKFTLANCVAIYDTVWKRWVCEFATRADFPTLAATANVGSTGFRDLATGKRYLWNAANGYYEA